MSPGWDIAHTNGTKLPTLMVALLEIQVKLVNTPPPKSGLILMQSWNEIATLAGGGVGQYSTRLSPYPRSHWTVTPVLVTDLTTFS